MIYNNGMPLKNCYGILYDNNENQIYKGELYEEKPKEVKNFTIYDYEGNKIYSGDFSSFSPL